MVSEGDQHRFLGVLAYEVTEACNLSVWHTRYPLATQYDQTLKNALLEAFLLHARCLLEFFLLDKSESIRAIHFLPAGWRPANVTELRTIYQRVCKHLSHMDKARASIHSSPAWDLAAILRELGSAFSEAVVAPAPWGEHLCSLGEQLLTSAKNATVPIAGDLDQRTSGAAGILIQGSTGAPPGSNP